LEAQTSSGVMLTLATYGTTMHNYIVYKHHLLHKNSDAAMMLSVANKQTGPERNQLLRKLDLHLKAVERRYRELHYDEVK
jgi:hypothetical protein